MLCDWFGAQSFHCIKANFSCNVLPTQFRVTAFVFNLLFMWKQEIDDFYGEMENAINQEITAND